MGLEFYIKHFGKNVTYKEIVTMREEDRVTDDRLVLASVFAKYLSVKEFEELFSPEFVKEFKRFALDRDYMGTETCFAFIHDEYWDFIDTLTAKGWLVLTRDIYGFETV